MSPCIEPSTKYSTSIVFAPIQDLAHVIHEFTSSTVTSTYNTHATRYTLSIAQNFRANEWRLLILGFVESLPI